LDIVNNSVEQVKSLAVANIEEFTLDYLYDRKRDAVLLNVEEVYKREIYRILCDMGYELIFSDYDTKTDHVKMVFSRLF
jgi:hypothetical protein